MLRIKLPLQPISINKCWQGKRYKTSDYSAWRQDFAYCSAGEKRGIQGWLEVKFKFYVKNYKSSDLDNFLKPALDAMVENKIIKDDRFIKRIIAEKFEVKEYLDQKIEIEIKALSK